MSTTEKKHKHLYHFSELSDYKISKHDPDVRGWSVKDRDNRVIGKVDNLLVNKDLERVVYLDVEVDSTIIEANHDPYGTPANENVHEFINKEGENHVIIPIGMVGFNKDQKYVYTDTIDYQTFAETKRYRSGTNIERHYEDNVLKSYKRDSGYIDDNRKRVHSNRDTEDLVDDGKHRGTSLNSLSDEEIRRREIEEREHPRHRGTEDRPGTGAINSTRHADTAYDREFQSETEKEHPRFENVNEQARKKKESGSDQRGNTSYDRDFNSKQSSERPQDEYIDDRSFSKEKGDYERKKKSSYAADREEAERERKYDEDDPFYDREEFRNREYRGRRDL
ncbi:hypothetical protein RM553_10480 [Zunongwangia sp. F363]|uniref:PRC-barrel domain-containing protein n=1 Tax=Autumnicola tepida TaxID=3075595 RepID=A0ABU3CA87_9FLAO|nr:hypothetical protein [Zunongwangia sp. F363]MDT0643254.1 hypothetical protein [Zunongwangia sp. F363]